MVGRVSCGDLFFEIVFLKILSSAVTVGKPEEG